MSVSTFEEITRSKPEKSLVEPLQKHAGRNNQGRVTTRHRGGGHKRMYRLIDFKRNKLGVPAKVFSIEYDPNRSARIALLQYADGEKRYILAPLGIKVGDTLMCCSDGLWHYFTAQELGSVLYSLPPREAAELLVSKARQRARGGGDNLSLAIVKLENLD